MDKFINPAYQTKDVLKKLKKAFKDDPDLPCVALQDFLTKEGVEKIREAAKKWKHTTIPDKHAYAESTARLGLNQFVKQVTGKQPKPHKTLLFRHKDFTVLHDEEKQPTGVIGLYCLSDWKEEWGGDVVFVKKGDTLGRFTPRKNTLVLVQRKRGVKSVIKYVNHKAGKHALVLVSVA